MANMSSSGIETVVQCLTKAVEAARGLDSNLSQNLCFVLNIANGEAGRVAKSMRKAAQKSAAAKPAKTAKPAKKAEKAEKPVKAEKAARIATPAKPQQQTKSRRRAHSLNGALAH